MRRAEPTDGRCNRPLVQEEIPQRSLLLTERASNLVSAITPRWSNQRYMIVKCDEDGLPMPPTGHSTGLSAIADSTLGALPLKFDLQWQSHGGIREVKDPDTAPQETSASFALPPRFNLCIKVRCQWIAR